MKNSDEWVEPWLTQREAEQLHKLLSRLYRERRKQFEKQGMSNDPASYTSLIRDDPRKYLKERYFES